MYLHYQPKGTTRSPGLLIFVTGISGIVASIVENQMDKTMETEMETGME